MRILGLDYGSKTVGVALSDPLGLIAQPLETIRREQENKLRRTLARVQELCASHEVELIVLGLPKNMDGSLGVRAEATLTFCEKLKARTGLDVKLWDERLTTNQADRILEMGGVRRENRKEHLDEMAASIILQSYLDARSRGGV
ncbi:MAG: Holliday junction resolvase RuvX [Blautia sp.]|nr:Holliday junction resolvase RuvX [Blautia sp.]